VNRPWVIVLLAASIGPAAHADAPPPASPDVEAEMAWARATWPDQFKDVRIDTPLARLLAWAPRRGTRTAYLYTIDIACRSVSLQSDEPDVVEGEPEPVTTMTAMLRGRAHVEEGRQVRGLKPLTVGDELTLETGEFPYEEKDARGRWRRKGGPALGIMPEHYGWLSYVDDRVARWDAEPLRLEVTCKGATEWLACSAGGEHPCERCDHFLVYLESAAYGYYGIAGGTPAAVGLSNPEIGVKRVATCRDRCPSHPDSPEVTRVRQLARRAGGFWRDAKTPLSKVSSLYLSRADCLREHPQRARASRDAW